MSIASSIDKLVYGNNHKKTIVERHYLMHFLLSYWEYIINLFEIILFYLYICAKLEKNTSIYRLREKQIIYLIIRYVLICTMNQCEVSSLITTIVTCLIEVGFACLFYSGNFIYKAFWGFSFSIICLVSEYFTTLIPHLFTDLSVNSILLGGYLRIPFTLLYIALIAFLVFVLSAINNKLITLSTAQKSVIITIALSGLFMAHYLLIMITQLSQNNLPDYFIKRLVVFDAFFILMLLFILIYVYKLGVTSEENRILNEDKKNQEFERKEYQNIIDTTISLREMKHDIEFHLNMINKLSQTGDMAELSKYVGEYTKSLNSNYHLLSTGNTAIDCILSSKLDVANKLNIPVDFSIVLPEIFPLDSFELSSLLGNLWNNAIEACERLNNISTNKFITFYIKPFHDMVIIHIENSYNGKIKFSQNNKFDSIKPQKGHGIGLKRINDIVHSANGIAQFKTDNNIFIVHILIPITNSPMKEGKTIENDNNNS